MILNRDSDLLAMAPTGSGKTAVALLAILQALPATDYYYYYYYYYYHYYYYYYIYIYI